MKKVLATLLAVTMIASMGSAVMASEVTTGDGHGIEARMLSNCPNCRSVLSITQHPKNNYKEELVNGTWVKFREVETRYFCNYCGFGTSSYSWVRA